ncbi:hypothetical protein [Tahibacter amnicola]|uniref:Periplasmic heavy metal sensor n=1 Tax=Tahibacter amnicola TaxID=2976241 RepID=A0ABY6BIP6_9GAMM|nr:hypothetical protein [Tahibacter amnicola]UXI69888.1 hypothetical protein N4264_09755 [Tahibacter amnicola]
MKKRAALITSLLLGSALSVGAYASLPRPAMFAPPTASELGLEGPSATQWNQLRAELLALRNDARRDMQSRIDALDTLLDDQTADFRQFHATTEQAVDTYRQRSHALTLRMISFYEALTPAEQAMLRDAMRDRLDRLQRIRAAVQALTQDAF